jgi:hypothetical protein
LSNLIKKGMIHPVMSGMRLTRVYINHVPSMATTSNSV